MPENPDLKHLVVPAEVKETSRAAALPQSLRHSLETEFGRDLSDVRVYEGHGATLLQAQAFARGTTLYFQPGAFQPHTDEGRQLIAHELTHVIQQREGTGMPKDK